MKLAQGDHLVELPELTGPLDRAVVTDPLTGHDISLSFVGWDQLFSLISGNDPEFNRGVPKYMALSDAGVSCLLQPAPNRDDYHLTLHVAQPVEETA